MIPEGIPDYETVQREKIPWIDVLELGIDYIFKRDSSIPQVVAFHCYSIETIVCDFLKSTEERSEHGRLFLLDPKKLKFENALIFVWKYGDYSIILETDSFKFLMSDNNERFERMREEKFYINIWVARKDCYLSYDNVRYNIVHNDWDSAKYVRESGNEVLEFKLDFEDGKYVPRELGGLTKSCK